MKIKLISFTKNGAQISIKIKNILHNLNHEVAGYASYPTQDLIPLAKNLKELVKDAFANDEAIIFVGAVGIAVRSIAPFLESKVQDPAVIVINELGEYVIPILSGHLGGANQLAIKIAQGLGSRAVITTATDLNKVFAVDLWAKENNLYIENVENIKLVSAAVLNGQKIGLTCHFPIDGEIPEFITLKEAETCILISDIQNFKAKGLIFQNTLILRPRQYVVGIGCRKNITFAKLEEFFLKEISKISLPPYLLKCIATIDIKKDEIALNELCQKYKLALKTYAINELKFAKGIFNSSKFVEKTVGIDNVCERAAVVASNGGSIILEKSAKDGCTMAIAMENWRCRF